MKEKSSSQHLYNIDIEEGKYIFTTRSGIKYIAYFICCDYYNPALTHTYMFNFEHEGTEILKNHDPFVKHTIIYILEAFFRNNKQSMIYVCDSSDGRHSGRKKLFDKWYKEYQCHPNNKILKKDIAQKGNYYDMYASLFIHADHPEKEEVLSHFNNLITDLTP
ncbi:DUF6169 family protein [Dysgonomonas sp. 25]|uniref:DUF6169 family protein n=1 Tax=Dysgonomonas sp. 25 TaxID=2302933 RepID=UPI0013D3564D|nr:DUF6169 family protein [Dysgonomonas sp. 25]NDV69257.1 hypothetical protein [Dysgonomonas sp. 25]